MLELKIGLLNLPPVISTIPNPIEIADGNEHPILENKYGVLETRTYRRLFIQCVQLPKDNPKLTAVLETLQKVGMLVRTEKLVALQEGETVEWKGKWEEQELTFKVTPAQQELYPRLTTLMENLTFEAAFHASREEAAADI